jgi:hypothetical protein
LVIVLTGAARVPAFPSFPVGATKNAYCLSSNTEITTRSGALVVAPTVTLRSNSSVLTSFGALNVGDTPVNVLLPPVTSGPDTWVHVYVAAPGIADIHQLAEPSRVVDSPLFLS